MKNLSQSLKELSPENRWTDLRSLGRRAQRRSEHGATAFEPAVSGKQPQDGAPKNGVDRKVKVTGAFSMLGNVMFEPEDARLTGGTRSLMRRALGLNFRPIKQKPQRALVVKGVPVKQPVAA